MTMKTQNLFPQVKPNPQFRDQLKLEVMEVYKQRRQARFNWGWLVAPGIVLTSLLLVVLLGNGQPFSQLPSNMQLSQSGVIKPTTPSQTPTQTPHQLQQDENNQSGQLTAEPQNLDQLDQELSELSNMLATDIDLEAAIAFKSL